MTEQPLAQLVGGRPPGSDKGLGAQQSPQVTATVGSGWGGVGQGGGVPGAGVDQDEEKPLAASNPTRMGQMKAHDMGWPTYNGESAIQKGMVGLPQHGKRQPSSKNPEREMSK